MDLLRMVLLLGGKRKPQLLPMEEQSIETITATASTNEMTISMTQLFFTDAIGGDETVTATTSISDMTITLSDAV